MLSNVDIQCAGNGKKKGINHFFENVEELALQPSSIDLTVGKICSPPDNSRSKEPILMDGAYTLPVGGTVVVETNEEVTMPKDHSGIMFPKSSALAERGILITNFGHIDPGYKGTLRFAIINLGQGTYRIHKGMVVITVVLFKLTTESNPSWVSNSKRRDLESMASKLSHDFIDLENRALKQIGKAGLKLSFWLTGLQAFTSALLFAVCGFAMTVGLSYFSKFNELNVRLAHLEGQIHAKESIDNVTQLHPKQDIVDQDISIEGAVKKDE